MQHTQKRFVSLLLCLVLALGAMPFGVWAAEIDTPPEDPVEPDPYTYVGMIGGGIEVANETATCRTAASLHVAYDDYPVTLLMKLQRSSDGSNWTTVKSWSVDSYGDVAMTRYWATLSYYSYRIYAYVTVKNANGNVLEIADITVYPL